MRRLYLRIYLAVLVSLAVFAMCAGLVWRQFGDAGPASHAFDVAGTLAQNVLPPTGASKAEQQAALERLACQPLQPRPASRRDGDAEARLAEILGHHLGEAGIVLDQQDARCRHIVSLLAVAVPAVDALG